MATPIHVPRINNNDDEVKVLDFRVAVGDAVSAGQIIGEVETDKAVLEVVAPADGFVLALVATAEAQAQVGSVLLWLGETQDEAVPETVALAGGRTVAATGGAISAKARLLMRQHGLKAEDIAPVDGRISVVAVEQHLAQHRPPNHPPGQLSAVAAAERPLPEVDGTRLPLTRQERGMAATVSWHRDVPVPGYIEIDYDLEPWARYAKRVQDDKGGMISPLLALMAWRLVEVATELPRINATLAGTDRYEYGTVNLGFTIQAGEALYVAVLRNAAALGEIGFVNAMGELQRRATAHKLVESEVTGATIGFSSMARWKVIRHIPVLTPHTAMMVAHAVGQDGRGTLGASYDHRVLNGGQVVAALRKLVVPKNL